MNRPRAEWLAPSQEQAHGWTSFEHAGAVTRCGGKAFNLGRLLAAGLTVPEGGVLGVEVLQNFLDETGLGARIEERLASLHDDDPDQLAQIEADVRAWFEATPWPPSMTALTDRVAADLAHAPSCAVRSSAVGEDAARASCAGLMDSVLDVTPGIALERAIRQVWASRWSARALAYERSGHGRLGAMAVIVQRQIDPWVAGVLFTRSPEHGCEDAMLCEYGLGLADKLVAGETNPARLRIARDGASSTRMDAAVEAPALDTTTVRALAAAGRSAEALFGSPQDIEFAIDRGGKLWLVQSRPITTGMRAGVRRRIVWSNANVNENFPEPISPLLYSIVAPGYSAYFANLGQAFGLARSRLDRMDRDLAGIVGVHAGRLYYNLTAIHSVLREAPCGEHLCAWFDEFTGACDPSGRSPSTRRSFVRNARDVLELVWIAARTTWQYLFIERRVRNFEARIDAYAAASAPARLASLDLIALRDLLRGFLDIRLRRWTHASLADAAAMVCYGALKGLVRRVVGEAGASAAHNDLLKGLSGLKSAEPVEALWRLAQCVRDDAELRRLFEMHSGEALLDRIRSDARCADFHARFQAYLDAWGFRCSGELMLTVPSFQERPAELLDIVRSYAAQADASLMQRLSMQQAKREAATRAVLDAARRRGIVPGLSLAPVVSRILAATQGAIGLRERARLKQALLYSRLRRVALEIGSRLQANGTLNAVDDVFFLTLHELDQWLSGYAMFPGAVRSLVAMRREAHARFFEVAPPDVFTAHEGEYPDPRAARPSQAAREHGLRGASVCGGVATGPAKVLTDVVETRTLARGDVLVTRQTDPGWAPAFVAIGGLVLERGGMLSHGAILAREYGIPTVVGVAGATERIVSGSMVRVDGDRGEVHRVDA